MNRHPLLLLTLLWAASLCLPLPAKAQYVSDSYSARALGMGGASRATAGDSSAIQVNPAALALMSGYQLHGDYRFFLPQAAHGFQLALIDHLTSRLATSVQWGWSFADRMPGSSRPGWVVVGEGDNDTQAYRGQDYRLSFALPMGSFALGTTLDWHRHKLAEMTSLEETSFDNLFTFHFGALYRPIPMFGLALAGTNLVPTHLADRPTTVALAVSTVLGTYALLEADLVSDWTTEHDTHRDQPFRASDIGFDLNLGATAMLWGALPIRVGFFTEDGRSERFLTTGIGLDSGTFAINYGLRIQVHSGDDDPVTGTDRLYHLISLDLSFGRPPGSL